MKKPLLFDMKERQWNYVNDDYRTMCFQGSPNVTYANSHSAMVIHVENLEMYEKLDELVKIPQLDVVFIGPGDLSQAIGKPGQLDDPELALMIEQIIRKSLAAHKAVGIFCGSAAAAKQYIDMGATYIALGSDVSCFGKALRGLKRQMSETISG